MSRTRRLRRRRDWETRLEEAMRRRQATPYTPGYHDCAMCAVWAVEMMTGEDVAAGLRGYTTERGARFRLSRHGGLAGLAERVAARWSMPEVHPGRAQRGDVVLIEADYGEALGVVWLNGREAMVADDVGVRALPVDKAIRAWRV